MAGLGRDIVFEDFFPSMVEKLGSEGFLKELQNGFRVLMDEEREVITFDSLKRNSALLGLEGMSDDELMCMLREGDMDGDGCLNEKEFCVLMESTSESHDFCLNRGSFSNPFIEPDDPLPLMVILNYMIDGHLDTDGFLLIVKKVVVLGVPYAPKTMGKDTAPGGVGIEGYVSCIHPAVDPAGSIQHGQFSMLEEPKESLDFVRGRGFPYGFELFHVIWVSLTVSSVSDGLIDTACSKFPITSKLPG
ncbi:Calcium-binding protein PBP1 [Capsicum annuum]|nr:Calcium-binding protein PBP1 [Capsicum annuum]KAF3674083.1 Calcium-binding protein PBP1 [Capsicum annuum]